MSLAELLAGMREEAEGKPELSRPVQVARLRDAAPRYIDQPRFKVGDLVTPRAEAPLRGHGDPMIVIETRYDDPHVSFEKVGSSGFGRPHHIRILRMEGDTVCAHWDEAADLEPYTGPTE